MFESGVLNFNELSIGEEGNHANGAVLGDQCALFLAKFIATLILTYEENLQMFDRDIEGPIDQETYSDAITLTLREFCAQDSRQHGRLIAMRDILSHLTEKKRLEKEQLACMYAKDLAVVRQSDVEDDDTIQ